MFRALKEKLWSTSPVAEENDVTVHKDVPYLDTNHAKHAVNVFVPKCASSDKLCPVIIFIHGGSWRRGDRNHRWFDSYNRLCTQLCRNMEFVVVNVGYRLSPEVKHPDHMLDILSAFKFVQENIHQYLGDSSRIILTGHSAGAHLSLLCCFYTIDPSLFSFTFNHVFPTDFIKGIAPVSAVLDVSKLSTMNLFVSKYIVDAAFDKHPDTKDYEYVSPIALVQKLLEKGKVVPPMLLMNAANDWSLEHQTPLFLSLFNENPNYSAKHYADSGTTHLSIIGLSSAFGNPYSGIIADIADFSRRTLLLDQSQQQQINKQPCIIVDSTGTDQVDQVNYAW